MTKKHYEAIAAIIAYRADMQYPSDKVGYGAATLRILAGELADYFATDNKNFDRARFLKACGIETRAHNSAEMPLE